MKIDSKENYNKDGILVVGKDQICCYQCINFECSNSCLVLGEINSVVSLDCDNYIEI